MTHQQWTKIERSLVEMSAEDKLELVERLVRELRVTAASGAQSAAPATKPLTEDEFKRQLMRAGLMTNLPTPADPMSRPEFQPITIEGEPLSETIIRERR